VRRIIAIKWQGNSRAFSAVFALSKTKKQGEFLKYQELTRIFLEISLKNKQ